MCASGFANKWHYPPQYRVGLEFNRDILSCRSEIETLIETA